MLSILVNGTPFSVDQDAVRTMGELVELVKANIDPDTIITSLAMQGRALTDMEWRVPLLAHGNATVEIGTGSKENYLRERLSLVVPYLETIEAQFTCTQVYFQQGNLVDGNTSFAKAARDFQAFLHWYGTLLELMPTENAEERQVLVSEVQALAETTEQLVQQELRQLWSVIAITIENRLVPQLQSFCNRCRTFRA